MQEIQIVSYFVIQGPRISLLKQNILSITGNSKRSKGTIDQLVLELGQSSDLQWISAPAQLPCLFEIEGHVAHEGEEVAQFLQPHLQQDLKQGTTLRYRGWKIRILNNSL